jgi:hypothetical protein
MKNPLTLAGIEPATSRFVAQHLNHYVCKSVNCVFYSVDFYYSLPVFKPTGIFIQFAVPYTTLALENCRRDGARDDSGLLRGVWGGEFGQ